MAGFDKGIEFNMYKVKVNEYYKAKKQEVDCANVVL